MLTVSRSTPLVSDPPICQELSYLLQVILLGIKVMRCPRTDRHKWAGYGKCANADPVDEQLWKVVCNAGDPNRRSNSWRHVATFKFKKMKASQTVLNSI